jgi:extracellular elastinolytic metalloproteinase
MVLLAAALGLMLVPGSMSAASAVNASPLEAALAYLDKSAGTFGVGSADVEDMFVTSSYRSTHTGVTHVNLNQRFQELEVFGGHVTVNVARNGGIVFAGGSPVELNSASGTARISATDAVRAAAAGLSLDPPTDLQVLSESGGPARETVVSGGGISDASIPVRLGWQPTESGLRLAWRLVIDDSAGDSLWNAAVDAENGRLLDTDDWTSKDTLGQLSTLKRTGSGSVAHSSAAAGAAAAAQVDDGSSYNVFAFPTESPNDASRQIVTNPADAIASPFGWHDTNGALGAEFTTTQGNNAHAYLDQDDSESPDFGGSPNGGPSLTFDFPADLNQHAQNYREAVVTNLFYGNNRFHDVTHHYGFDEPSGNFQANNYGRGGGQGDYVRAEAADGGGTNNANFSTPAADSGTPRMQMFLWPGNQFGSQNQVVVDAVGSFNASWSRFGPAPTTSGLPGRTLVYAGTGCTAGLYPAPLPPGDWMVIVDGGTTGTGACPYLIRVQVAESLGADAVIVAHNTTAAAPVLTASMAGPPVGIPAVAVTQADGNAIKAALALGPKTGSIRKHPDHPGIRDGDFENGIIIHEYGHGVSQRLTGGPGINCLNGNEQGGEGWSDWFALTTLLDLALDNPEGPRGMGPYALFQANRQGNGIRPRPYSRNMEIQPFTYDSIKTGGWLQGASLAVPHGIGHGWASVLWDMTWELIDKHGFNPDLFAAWDSAGNTRALQYVMDGLKLQGCAPGFVVARAAIIAGADLSSNGGDTCTLWASFARRGLGFSAVQGTSASRDDNKEAFDTHPDCLEGFFGGIAAGPTLNVVNAGASRDMTFTLGGNQGLDILASNSPYSRQVDCNTLETVAPGQFITPRPIPVPTETPGRSGLTYDPATDRYTYPWKTLKEWDGTCREFVLTRTDGVQHRAYFRFSTAPSFSVSGRVRDASGQAVAGATVSLDDGKQANPLTTTTDASGFYFFASVLKATYQATASVGGCLATVTQQVVVRGPTTLNFTLPPRTDAFGYSCSVETTAFTEAANVLALTGDDAATAVPLPFPFRYYGQEYTTAFVSTNGHVNFLALSTSLANVALPATAAPNAAIYGFWDDLFVDSPTASVRTELLGTAPNRRFVVEWRNVRFFGDTTRRIDLNIVLHENGQILTQSRNRADDGRERGNSATLGIENATGTVALQFSFNQPVLDVEPAVTSIRYRPPA